MRITTNKIIDLPFEVDKVYKTKFQNGDLFNIIKIEKEIAYGYYMKQEYIGICPLRLERLIPDKIKGEEYEICDKCNTPL